MNLIGYSFFGQLLFRSPTSAIRETKYLDISNAIFDEVHVKDGADSNTQNQKESWQITTRLLAKFKDGSLEAGNVFADNLKIEQFVIKRRKVDELQDTVLSYLPFQNNTQLDYLDVTQANDNYIYTINPIAENGLEGFGSNVQIESDFTGWWVVDKDTDEVLSFDKALGSVGNVDTVLNQDRVQIQTMSKYPSVWYSSTEYHTFTLSTVILPDEFQRSGKAYENIMNKFIRTKKPLIIKSGDGRIFVCDISSPQISQPKNVWKGHDYFELQIQATEIMDYDEFMRE